MCAHRDLSGALFRIAAREPLKRLRFSFTISLFAFAPLVSLTVGCASTGGHFPLRQPIWRDPDMHPFNAPCRPDPDPPKDQPKHQLCLPETYESPLMWDAANNTVFRPIARFFATDPGGEAVNVNSVDEVPDSSWFVNRIGRRPMSAGRVRARVVRGEGARSQCPGRRVAHRSGKAQWRKPGLSDPRRGRWQVHAQSGSADAARTSDGRNRDRRAPVLRSWFLGAVRQRRLLPPFAPEAQARPHVRRTTRARPSPSIKRRSTNCSRTLRAAAA